MAYETWSGGRISSEDTPSSRSPRGGYIPLSEIPNAPKTVEMPLPRYQAIPSIRREYVKQDIDMESRAAKLMQKPLPGSFEEAGDIRTAAAGKGQAAWGNAIESGGKEVASALGTFSNALARLQYEALKSKDETDKLKYDRDEKWYQAGIDNITKTKPYEEWGAEKKKLDEKFTNLTSQYGTTRVSKDRIALRRASLIGTPERPGWADTHFQTATANRQLEADLTFHTQNIEENRKNGKGAESEMSYHYLESRGYYSEDRVKLEKEKDAQVEGQIHFANAMQLNPRMAMNEAKTVLDGGTSKDFPNLNTANAATAYAASRQATNAKDQETLTDLSNAFAMGRTTDPAEIERLARARGLPDEDILTLRKGMEEYATKAKALAEKNMTLDPAALTEAKRRIASYDEANDSGNKIFTDNVHFINSSIPPEQRPMLMEKLNAKNTKSMSAKKPEDLARDREKDSLTKEIIAIGDKGMQFTDPDKRELFLKAKQFLKENKDTSIKDLPPDQLAAWREGNQWTNDRLNDLDSKTIKEPDFDPAELRTKVREDMAPDLQKNIGTSPAPTPSPRGTPNLSGVLTPTKEQLAVAPGVIPSEWVATAPRDVKRESAEFQKAYTSTGETFKIARVTAYIPGSKVDPKMEGPNKVATRKGPAFTFEGYQRGTFPYVSAAVDPKGELAGQYFISPAYPNVVFKGEDVGPAFEGKGSTAFDIAFDDPKKRTDYSVTDIEVKVIGEADALSVSGATRREGTGGAYSSAGGAMPALVAKVDLLRQQFPGMGKITSGYRDEKSNKAAGGASDSEHTHGNAVDISVAGMSIPQQRQLIRAASLSGIKGIGVYGTKLHFDLGLTHGARAWGPSYKRGSVPAWAESEIQEHEKRYGVG